MSLPSVDRAVCVYIGRVGDVIVATPFLRALRRRHPKAHIKLVVGWRSRQVLPLIPFVDEWSVLEKPLNLPAHARLAASLLSSRSDLLVDLNSSFSKTSTLIAKVARAEVRLGFDKQRGPRVFDLELPAPAVTEHMYERYGRLAAALDADYSPEPELRLPRADVDEAERLLPAELRAPARFKVAIHPGNFDRFAFRWPEEKFVELAGRLQLDPRLKVCFLAGPGELEKVKAIAGALAVPAPVLPPARLGVSGALLKRMDLFVCNITGTTHLAAALGVPTFGFYAGYTQTVWRPRGARHGGTVNPSWDTCRDTTVDEAHAALTDHIARLASWG